MFCNNGLMATTAASTRGIAPGRTGVASRRLRAWCVILREVNIRGVVLDVRCRLLGVLFRRYLLSDLLFSPGQSTGASGCADGRSDDREGNEA